MPESDFWSETGSCRNCGGGLDDETEQDAGLCCFCQHDEDEDDDYFNPDACPKCGDDMAFDDICPNCSYVRL